MKKSKKINNEWILPGLLTVWVAFMTIVSPITWFQGALFLAFQIWSILIPGETLLILLKIKTINSIEKKAWGYSFGYILNILLYFVLSIFQCMFLLVIVQGIITIVSTITVIRQKRKLCKDGNVKIVSDERKQWSIISIFIFLVLVIRFMTYYCRNLLPDIGQNVTFPVQDILFYIGNAISAMKGFPVEEFRFAGEQFFYHYFGSIQLGMMSTLTGIDALSLEVCLAWIQPIFILIPSFWCLLNRMQIQFNKKILALFILLFTTGWELLVYVAYQHIMYVSSFGYDIALAFGILTITFMYMQVQENKLHMGLLVATLLTFFACEGCKAPLAVVILCVLGSICAMWLFTNKDRRHWAFVYGFTILGLFIILFFGVVSEGLNTVTTNASGLRFTLTGHLYECGLGNLYFDWTAQGMPGILGKILVFILYYFGCNFIAYYLFSIGVIQLCKKGITRLISFVGALAVGVSCGLLLTLITKQTGNSQMYFAMTSFPLAILFAFKVWNDFPVRSKLFQTGLLLTLAISVVSFGYILQPTIFEGYQKLSGTMDYSQESNSLNYEEYEAYKWIRDNTEENSLCVTNVIMEDRQYQSFIVGVCTERQMYMEGWRYVVGVMEEEVVMQRRDDVCDFFYGDISAYKKMLSQGIDYVIWTKRYGPDINEYETIFGEKVYENDAVIVYNFS